MLTRTLMLGCLAWPIVSAANPVVIVDDGAPFTAEELDRAVALRAGPPRDVRVRRDGEDLVIEVGGASHRVRIAAGDSHEAARVVAMVIVALDGSAPAPVGSAGVDRESVGSAGVDRESPAVLASVEPARSARRPWAARVTLGIGRDDGGTYTHPVTGALSYALSGSARVVASGAIMRATTPTRGSLLVPVRLGVEGRAGATGLELGGFIAGHRDCVSDIAAAFGGYIAGRVYLPYATDRRFVLEASGYYAVRQGGGCSMGDVSPAGLGRPEGTLYFDGYGAALSAGIEWQL